MAKNKIHLFIMLIVGFFVEIFSRNKLSPQDVCKNGILLASWDTNRYGKINGMWFSPILEPIGKSFKSHNLEVVRFVFPPCLDFSTENYGGAIYANIQFVKNYLLKLFDSILFGKEKANERASLRMVSFYKKLFIMIRPRIIFGISLPPEFSKAARQLGILIVEAYHGTQLGTIYPGSQRKYSGEEYEYPHIFLSFDRMSHDSFTHYFKLHGVRSILTPHPWHIETLFSHSDLIPDISQLDLRLSEFKAAILVILQWGYDGELPEFSGTIPNGFLHSAVEEAFKRSEKSILWLVRLHPVQLRGYSYSRHRTYAQRLSRAYRNVEVDMACNFPLPSLFSRVCGHITMSSGSTREAANMGIPSLALCPSLKRGGINEGMFSDIEPELITYGELEAKNVWEWVLIQTERTCTIKKEKDYSRDENIDISRFHKTMAELLEEANELKSRHLSSIEP